MTCWQRIDALKKEAKRLEDWVSDHKHGWSVIDPIGGKYRAKKRTTRSSDSVTVTGKTPDEVIEQIKEIDKTPTVESISMEPQR
jgi:hypothetical protein